jgi:hypothetical protein
MENNENRVLKRRRTLPPCPPSDVPPDRFFVPGAFRASAPSVENRDSLLDSLNLNAVPAGELFGDGPGDDDAHMARMSFEDLVEVKHKNCFGCQRINQESLKENEHFLNMMKLYRDNCSNTCGESVYRLVKEYFDEEIKPILDDDDTDTGIKDWPLEVIHEHFQRHTNYATDEVLRQINITTALRDHMMNFLVQVDSGGDKAKYDVNYIKVMITLNQEIRKLRSMRKELPNMIGFDNVLNH